MEMWRKMRTKEDQQEQKDAPPAAVRAAGEVEEHCKELTRVADAAKVGRVGGSYENRGPDSPLALLCWILGTAAPNRHCKYISTLDHRRNIQNEVVRV
jgi:hypothetical protein